MKKYTPCGGCGATEPDQRCIGCMHPFTEEEEKEQVKKGVAIIGHGSSNEEDDQLKFLIERGDLWKHRAISAELELEELKKQPGAVWVKAKDRLPGWKKRVKWRDGNNHSYATDGEISLSEMEKPNLEGWEWYDESAAGREDAVDLIEYIRNNYKPSKEVWQDKFGIALLSDEGVLSKYKQQKEK